MKYIEDLKEAIAKFYNINTPREINLLYEIVEHVHEETAEDLEYTYKLLTGEDYE